METILDKILRLESSLLAETIPRILQISKVDLIRLKLEVDKDDIETFHGMNIQVISKKRVRVI